MTDTKAYTLRRLARALNPLESTTPYYRDTFARHVPWAGSSPHRRHPEKALETLRFIAESYTSGNTREQIESAWDSNVPTEADIVVAEDVLEVEGKTPPDDGSPQVRQLEEELSQERDLVESLRQPRLELERRTAMAEERLREARDRPGLLARLLNRHD